jgi:PAS domain S-box-containing protein
MEKRYYRKNGELVWINLTVSLLRDSNGEPQNFTSVIEDINERKKTEEALRREQELTRNILETAPSLTYIFDIPEWRNVFISNPISEILGYSAEEINRFGANLIPTILHPEDAGITDARFARILADRNGETFELEYRMRHKSGDYVWLFDRTRVFQRDETGKPTQILGVTTDITERKIAEGKLQTANYRFRIAQEAAKGFNYEWNLQTNTVTRSENIEKVIGYSRGELPTTWAAWTNLIHPDDVSIKTEAEAREFISQQTEETFGGEYRVRHKNGNYIWLLERGLIIRDADGNPLRVIGQTVDVTERKEQEVKIIESEERYRALTEASAQVVWTMDSAGRGDSHLHWFVQLIGIPLEELMRGKKYLDYIHPEDRANLQKVWQQVTENPAQYEVEFRLKPDGEDYHYYNLRGVPLFNNDGTLREWIGTVKDITESRTAEKNLRESEAYRRLLIESAHDYAVIGISVRGVIQSWSKGAEKIFGYAEAEIIGQSADIIFTPEDRAENVPNKEMETALREGTAADERWHIRHDGSRFFASGVMHKVQSHKGNLLGFVKIARDQTEKLAAEKALRDRELLQSVVGALEDERRRIARDLHDELGQQLIALRLKLESVRRMCNEDEEICLEIDKVQMIARQIDNGVDFLAWELRPAVLDHLGLYAALEKYVREWSNYSQISAELLPSSLKTARFDSAVETNLYRITQEALNNIHKHARATKVEIFLEKRDNIVILIISDDGKGFNPKKKTDKVTGIGLVGMRERATLIGGKLEIESAAGKGTTIYIRIPLKSP